jgi:hypothetical protein
LLQSKLAVKSIITAAKTKFLLNEPTENRLPLSRLIVVMMDAANTSETSVC